MYSLMLKRHGISSPVVQCVGHCSFLICVAVAVTMQLIITHGYTNNCRGEVFQVSQRYNETFQGTFLNELYGFKIRPVPVNSHRGQGKQLLVL